jgi:MAM domain, meprin/A5/mu
MSTHENVQRSIFSRTSTRGLRRAPAGAHLGLLTLGFISAAFGQSKDALALPKLIPKPAPLDNYGMEAAASVALTQDFLVMGAYKTRESHNDSPGGVYLFENGNNNPAQFLEPSPELPVEIYSFDETGGELAVEFGPPRLCTTHTLGAQVGEFVAASDQWLAATANLLGRAVSQDVPAADCGTTPAVLLAKRAAAGEAKPFGPLQYTVAAPFGDVVRGIAVTDSDLAIKTNRGLFFYIWDGFEWIFEQAFTSAADLTSRRAAPLATDGLRFVLGDPAEGTVTTFAKQQGPWQIQGILTGDAARGFGTDVDIDGQRMIVGGEDFVAFYSIDLGGVATLLSQDNSRVGTRVAISGETGVAYGLVEGTTPSVQYYRYQHHSGVYAPSGALSGLEQLPAFTAANQRFLPNEIDILGATVVAGSYGYNAPGNQLVGAAVYDKVVNVFETLPVVGDDADGLRSWVNAGKFDWSRRKGGSSTEATGPSSGVTGSAYYNVDTSFGYANSAGDEAILETEMFDATNRGISFAYNMRGSNVGSLRLEVFSQGSWQEVWRQDGQTDPGASVWRSTDHLPLAPYTSHGKIKLRFRYIAAGGPRGDVALDDIYIGGPHICAPRCGPSDPSPGSCYCDAACESYGDCCSPSGNNHGREYFAGVNYVCAYAN